MKLISWNAQGCNSPKTYNHLEFLLSKYKPEIVFISETKMGLQKMEITAKKLQSRDWIIVPSIGKSGGQIVAWNNNITVDLISINQNIISVSTKVRGVTCYISCVYGALSSFGKHSQWEYLRSLNDQFKGPWLVVGDMNFIINSSDKEGGNDALSSDASFIKGVIQKLGLIDMRFIGDPFTWKNRR